MPYVISGGVQTRYEVDGSGPPLVLHIGFLGSLEDWSREDAAYVQALRDAFRLILVDPRGQGKSDAPHTSALYTPEARARDVVAVLDDLEIERAHFWGYSMGGRVGLMLASRHQHRLRSLVVGGASPLGEPRDPTSTPLYQWLEHGMSGFVAEWEHTLGPLPGGARERWLAGDAEALRASLLAPDQSDEIVASLGDVKVPALLYAGSEDDPHLVRQTAELMPNAEFVPLDGLNHAAAFRRSDLILPHVVKFLAKVEKSTY